MTAMTDDMEVDFIASLLNPEHGWEVLSRAIFDSPLIPGINVNNGGTIVTGPDTPAKTSITYQIRSLALDLSIVAVAQLEDGVLNNIDVYFDGTTLSTDNGAIYSQLEVMSTTAVTDVQSKFSAFLRKKFAPEVSMTTGSELTAEGVLTIT